MRIRTLPALVLVALAVAACPKRSDRFRYQIDSGVQPEPAMLGERPLAAVQDDEGRTSLFIANEVILSPRNSAELESFLARHGGTVVATDAVPEPPPELGISLDPSQREPTQYTVRLDPSAFPLDDFVADVARAGLAGDVSISSEPAARLLALITKSRIEGLRVSPNFVGEPHRILLSTEEHPTATGFENAFDWAPFRTTGSRSSVTRAWQLMAARELPRDISIAVIDGGFFLLPFGNPLSSDLPNVPVQYDFVDDDRVAAGMNPNSCTGGSPCPWHGHGSASVAAATLDNQHGAAGTGGLIATPWLFKTDLNWDQVSRAIRTAVAWGAHVISMSFGAECDNVFCDGYFEFNIYPALRNARDSGVVAVASAGNRGWSTNAVPCKGDAVVCVGALADGVNTAVGWSNFGPHVDIFAPTNIPAMPDGSSGSNRTVHGGTSASAPFVAGVLAMMRACDRTLLPFHLITLLQAQAWTDSPDPKVGHYLNAYGAVEAVCTGSSPMLRVDPESAPRAPLNRESSFWAWVYDVEDGFPCGRCPVTWSPAPLASAGSQATYRFTTPGTVTLRVRGEDTEGAADEVEIPVTVVNERPTAFIDEPASGSRVPRGMPVNLRGFGQDPNEGPGPNPGRLDSGCRWTSSLASDPFPETACSTSKVFATNGVRTLRLTVTDSQGEASVPARAVITVVDPPTDPGPVASFSVSEPNYLDHYGFERPITLRGTATDDPDTPYTYEWVATSFTFGSLTNVAAGPRVIGSGETLTWSPAETAGLIQAGDYRCFTEGQWVRIELRTRDARGNPGRSVSRLIRVSCVFL